MTRIRQGKAAKRANDVVRLMKQGQYLRAHRLAEKRNIEVCTSAKKMINWGLVCNWFSEGQIYARIAK